MRRLAGTEGATSPVFSPDGAWIAFFADSKLKKVPVLGGSPTVVNEGNSDTLGLDWAPDGTIVFTRGFTLGLARVSASGGAAQTIMTPDPQRGKRLSLAQAAAGRERPALRDQSREQCVAQRGTNRGGGPGSKDSREILDAQGSFPLYSPSGHLVFFSGGSVRAAPFDLKRRKMTGPAVPVVEGVSVAPHTGAVQAAISSSGTLIYAPVGDQLPKTAW